MGNWFKRAVLSVGARLLGIGAGLATAKIAEKTGIIVDPESVATAALVLGGYVVAHRAVSSKFNPGDAASARMARAEKEAVATGHAVQPERKK